MTVYQTWDTCACLANTQPNAMRMRSLPASTPSSRNIEAEQGHILEEFAQRFYCLKRPKIADKVHVLNMKVLSGHQKEYQ